MDAPIDLNLVRAFVAVHEGGSFSAAASRLGVPRSTVSRAVAALERGADVRLFQRTTRAVTITAAGLALFARVAPSLAALETSLAELPDTLAAPSGTLRITTTHDLGTTVVAGAVVAFRARYPDVRVEAHLGPELVDLVRDCFDLALRYARGPLKDAALVARKVGVAEGRYYASPSYLARRGTPRVLADLTAHDVVRVGDAPARGPRRADAAPRASIGCDDKFFAREVLRQGGGIGLLPSYFVEADVLAGRLARVLPRVAVTGGGVYLVQPSREHVPRRVTAFRDVLLERLRQTPLDA